MLNDKTIEEYYKLKLQEAQLKKQIGVLREEIIRGLKEDNTCVYSSAEYIADIRYFHQTTPAFIDFLKYTNNNHLIKETASCSAYQEMKYKYHFSSQQEKVYYEIKDTPALYVTKK